ncbi:hypothetical protein Ana3638_11810 [Anaerocolumna sedimenticola]|uniref:RNA polymerase sigma factor 70 region 4 type 2 domain-containing protein n=1 Tax=Anaerocolumna sedimenticola TaxID=2696063 RepID=A0A6P1TLS5_9FIRM|nr:hypothetical protein [Anaerocolumna sedimenticola]QHQ61373.1 hypothetical protein Ana3638_11810 [Anaerocolumna sedimenticola]
MKENYYALLICILKPVTVEQSFMMMDGVFPKQNRSISKRDVKFMIIFKRQGMAYKEIGELFGISAGAVYNRIRRNI